MRGLESKTVSRAKTINTVSTPQALKVYYGTYPYAYSETETTILCDQHRSTFFSLNPTAYGAGEYFPVNQCDQCKVQQS